MTRVTLQGLRGFAESLNNKKLETSARRRPFSFTVDHRGFNYIPESSGKTRVQKNQYIEAVINRFNDIRSFNPRDYRGMTVNASYLLVLIKKYTNAK